jgi:hypothetical protein
MECWSNGALGLLRGGPNPETATSILGLIGLNAPVSNAMTCRPRR